MAKNKKLILLLQIDAKDATDMVLNQNLNQLSCSMCGGQGKVRSSQGFFTIQQTCPECSGSGEQISNPCKECRGIGKKQTKKKISTNIPKGVDDGTRIRLSGKGEAGIKGGGMEIYIFLCQ